MPKYRIKLASGGSLVFEGDQEPTDQEVQQAAQDAGVQTLLMNPRQGEPDRNLDAQSWRNGADPEGAMAMAGVAQEHPAEAVAGAAMPLVSALGSAIAPAGGMAGYAKDALASGVMGGAEGFLRSKGDLGTATRDALLGAATGPILKWAGGRVLRAGAKQVGAGLSEGMGTAAPAAAKPAIETVGQTVGRLRGVSPDIAGSQWTEDAFRRLIAQVGEKEALRQYGIGQFGKDASGIVLK